MEPVLKYAHIPNFNLFRADRPNDTRFGGSAIFVHKALRVERLDWFTGLESLAVNIVIDSVRFNVVCLYRSTSLVDMKDNAGLLGALERLPVNADEELVIVGDVNLPHVNWDKSLVERPPNSGDRRLLMESEFLNVFTRKGLKWYVTGSSTRVRKVGDTTQCSLLDQVFSNNECFVNNVDILAPLGKSDHVSLLVELKVKNNVEFLTSKKKSWYKVNQDFVNTQSSDISWGTQEKIFRSKRCGKNYTKNLVSFQIVSQPPTLKQLKVGRSYRGYPGIALVWLGKESARTWHGRILTRILRW